MDITNQENSKDGLGHHTKLCKKTIYWGGTTKDTICGRGMVHTAAEQEEWMEQGRISKSGQTTHENAEGRSIGNHRRTTHITH